MAAGDEAAPGGRVVIRQIIEDVTALGSVMVLVALVVAVWFMATHQTAIVWVSP